MINTELLYEKVMFRLDMSRETGEEELQEIILGVLRKQKKRNFFP